ncbi:glycosyltransferase [Kineosporia sp. J2-2]|uniref:Glycosyltransferase n=1 Tax=Kineosporia corallincola TaxID=2835133 RepID=A0ABS5T8T4_9ACTN|nr:glycosyltransferase family 4 protein [Kineosporia corallincola]MBT0767447.1 glycosyltransferase [Kineosporia corallincola]
MDAGTNDGTISSAVFITATEPEPRKYGKPVVIGGILDHLCERLGPENVHLILIGRADIQRPDVPYQRHVLGKPGTVEQATSVLANVVLPPRFRPAGFGQNAGEHSGGRYRHPLQEAVLHSAALGTRIFAKVNELEADLEIWDTVRMGQYVLERGETARDRSALWPTAATAGHQVKRRILYADDLFSERYDAMLKEEGGSGNPGGEFAKLLPGPAKKLLANPKVHRPLLRLERDLVAASETRQPEYFDGTYLISPEETARLQAKVPGASIGTLPPLLREPNSSRVRHYTGAPEFTFIGGFDYAPNRDGLDWFLQNCLGPVRQVLPNVAVNVVGPGTDAGLPSGEAWGGAVRFLGWVDDLDTVLNGSAALLSPLRTGSGVKIKVLEALARALPVVGTRAGVQGIEGAESSGLLIGETPEELASAMLRATDPIRNQQLSAAARTAWDTRFSPPVVRRRYDEIFGLARAIPPETRPIQLPRL